MKKVILFAAIFLIMSVSFTSCSKNCKVCQQNTYNSSGTLLTSGTDTEYCGAELLVIENTADVTVGGTTTKWVCR